MSASCYVPLEELEAGWGHIFASPKSHGKVELIVRRPGREMRETLVEAQLDTTEGLIGDDWRRRGSTRTADGSANPNAQLTLMNSRAIALIARERERWPLAGDQVYADIDLSAENLPAGSRVSIGQAVIEITAEPHTGCASFKKRYGNDAIAFVNSKDGRAHRLRGANARIITGGVIRVGDSVVKL